MGTRQDEEKKLGEGGYGIVVLDPETGQAIKRPNKKYMQELLQKELPKYKTQQQKDAYRQMLNDSKKNTFQAAMDESSILHMIAREDKYRLLRPYIVRWRGWSGDQETYDYQLHQQALMAPRWTTLDAFIKKYHPKMNRQKKSSSAFRLQDYFRSIIPILWILVNIVALMHNLNIVHRDLKPTNIMVSMEEPFVKLIDFGISCAEINQQKKKEKCRQKMTSTKDYASPIFRNESQIDLTLLDRWSLGLILYECVHGVLPIDLAQEQWRQEASYGASKFDNELNRLRFFTDQNIDNIRSEIHLVNEFTKKKTRISQAVELQWRIYMDMVRELYGSNNQRICDLLDYRSYLQTATGRIRLPTMREIKTNFNITQSWV